MSWYFLYLYKFLQFYYPNYYLIVQYYNYLINNIEINNKNTNKKIIENNNSEISNKSMVFLNSNYIKRKKIKKRFITKYNENSKKSIEKYNKKDIKESKIDYNEYELNSLKYKEALKYDKRTFCQYYFSILKINNLLLFSFFPNFDFNSKIIKLSLFFISFSLYFAVNTLFFTDSTMNKIYMAGGIFETIYEIPQIIYSSIISGLINYLLKYLSLSQKYLLQIKRESSLVLMKEKPLKVIKCLYIKFIIFYILTFLLLLFFWYYISCFCVVYYNTQLILIKDTLYSFALSLIYPIIICLFPALFRIPSLKSETKAKEIIYNFSKLLQLI